MSDKKELVMTPGGSEELLEKIEITVNKIQQVSPHLHRAQTKELITEIIEYARELEWRTIHLTADLQKMKARLEWVNN